MTAEFTYLQQGALVSERRMTNYDLSKTDPGTLAKLMTLGNEPQRIWRPEELAVVFSHQMAAVVQFDLAGLDEGIGAKLMTLSAAEGLLVRSFADLFQHSNPPIELLILTKQFAKANINHPDSSLPREVAKVMYYGSIAVALVRCAQRITELDDCSLRQGVEWAIAQTWIDEPTRAVLREGLDRLCAGTEAGHE